MNKHVPEEPSITNDAAKLLYKMNTENNKMGSEEKVEIKIKVPVKEEEEVEKNKLDETNEWKDYCPFVLPKGRDITALDDLISIKKNLNDFRNETLTNLGLETLDYDLKKIEERKNLLNNYNIYSKDKWYLFFQPLNNVSIEHYWKYEKVTLTDIINSVTDTSKNLELKKNKKHLKHVAKYILSGKPHESLVKNGYKVYTNFLNSASKYYFNPLNTANASLLSLKNSKCINDSDKLLNWKLKFTNNLSILQNLKAHSQLQSQLASRKKENSSAINMNDTREKKRTHLFNQGSSDVGINKHSGRKVIKDNTKKNKKKRH